MLEILLIVALTIAIIMDIIRIHQYRLATGRNKKKFIKELAMKYETLYWLWDGKGKFEDYAVKHWDNEE